MQIVESKCVSYPTDVHVFPRIYIALKVGKGKILAAETSTGFPPFEHVMIVMDFF